MSNDPREQDAFLPDRNEDGDVTPQHRELSYELLGTSEPQEGSSPSEADLENSVPPEGGTSQTPQAIVMRTNTLSILMFVLCFLLALYLIPTLADQISYSLARGTERAKAEVATQLLEEIPSVRLIIPWVVKKAAPSVVSVQPIGNQEVGDGIVLKGVPIGQGSGFIVDKEGYIVTNHHVIAVSRTYRVSLSDGRQTENVRLVGYDPATDVAVLKINLNDLTPVTWGDSNELEVGESVLAIGSPYSFSNTVTSGIVSAKERYTQDFGAPGRKDPPQEYLQTDAAVNPGNSGGPLINMHGEVVGINTAIIGEAYRGICFAIPSTLAKRIYEEIRDKGKVSYGLLGINMSPQRVSDPNDEGHRAIGVRILEVQPNLPAEKAGMKPGDVITNWNGVEVRDYVQLNHQILFTSPGTQVKVTCLRNGKPIEFDVTVAQRPIRISR